MRKIAHFDCSNADCNQHGLHRLRTHRNSPGTSGTRRNTVREPGQQRARATGHYVANPRSGAHGLPDQLGALQPGISVLPGFKRGTKGQRLSVRQREHAHAGWPDAGRDIQGPTPGPVLHRKPLGTRMERPLDRHLNHQGYGRTGKAAPTGGDAPTCGADRK